MRAPSTAPTLTAEPATSPTSEFVTRVVVIDHRRDRRELMAHVLEQNGNAIVVGYADGPATAVKAVDRSRADTAVLEIQLPVTQGLDTISALREDFPTLGIIVCSFHANPKTKQLALDRGADAYLVKPFSLRDLRVILQSASRRSTSCQ